MMNNVTQHPHAAHRYQSSGILSMPKLNFETHRWENGVSKWRFEVESGAIFLWHCWRYQFELVIWMAMGLAWTGNLVQPLVPVKWLGLSVTPCPSVSIW